MPFFHQVPFACCFSICKYAAKNHQARIINLLVIFKVVPCNLSLSVIKNCCKTCFQHCWKFQNRDLIQGFLGTSFFLELQSASRFDDWILIKNSRVQQFKIPFKRGEKKVNEVFLT